MTIAQAIASRIRELLEEKGITQYKLAGKMLIFQQSMSNIMNAKSKAANVKTIFHICRGLEITIVDFFNSPLFLANDNLDID